MLRQLSVDGRRLDLPSARVTAIVGANGTGKTRLVRALRGMTSATVEVQLHHRWRWSVDREPHGIEREVLTRDAVLCVDRRFDLPDPEIVLAPGITVGTVAQDALAVGSATGIAPFRGWLDAIRASFGHEEWTEEALAELVLAWPVGLRACAALLARCGHPVTMAWEGDPDARAWAALGTPVDEATASAIVEAGALRLRFDGRPLSELPSGARRLLWLAPTLALAHAHTLTFTDELDRSLDLRTARALVAHLGEVPGQHVFTTLDPRWAEVIPTVHLVG